MNRIVNIRLLGDGSGRVCVHWFIRDEIGPIRTPGTAHMTALGPIPFGGVVGRIACNPDQNTVTTQQNGMEFFPCCHSDDVRAATCPKCLETSEAKAMIERLKSIPAAVA